MQGEPGPAPAEPRLERIAMRPMLAHEIGKGELALDRDQRPHERPADKDRDPRRCKRDGLGTAIRSMPTGHAARSEERRVGKECVSTCRSRWSPYNLKKKQPRTYTLHLPQKKQT